VSLSGRCIQPTLVNMAIEPGSGMITGVWADAGVDVWRGPLVESRHEVSVAVVDSTGAVIASVGGISEAVFARSAVKPLQALPLVEEGVLAGFGLGEPALALACASHSGEPRHVDVARTMLQAIGLDERALACGPQWPFHEASTRALRHSGHEAGRIHNNCSGKHAGMLALAVAHGWATDGYHEISHPVQQRMLGEMARWAGMPAEEIGVAVDGCGVATFALPLARFGGAFARLATAAGSGDSGPARVLAAMARHPELVAGTGRLCTQLMQVTGGRIIAKVGAEGVYCAAVMHPGLGIALKVRDGAKRAAEPALLEVLRVLGLLSTRESKELERYARPAVRNTRGEAVGELVARISSGRADG
jgi:L-asparaginase II